MLEAFDRALRDYWPWERELLAVIAELLHQILLVTAKAHGAKDRDLPEPLRIPRPGAATRMATSETPPSNVISFKDFMRMTEV